jgi:hypothetical protein
LSARIIEDLMERECPALECDWYPKYLVAPIYRWFTEGCGTRDLVEVKVLLREAGLSLRAVLGGYGPSAEWQLLVSDLMKRTFKSPLCLT